MANIAEQGEGPLVLLCRGFPESWYSWRHQIEALAAAGLHAVAPDMRGYGKSDRPEAIDQYTIFHLVGDLVGLLDALETPRAVVVGHDWGATIAWQAARLRPDRFRAVANLSVPYRAHGPAPPTTLMPQTPSVEAQTPTFVTAMGPSRKSPAMRRGIFSTAAASAAEGSG